ncbi:hypothetical protein [Caulobacter sp. S45]|uniref:hypothetical protein n=1 Tax=Caulobacter sp. S45 TaxID=1641861 RepID=UPI00131E2FC7|nr:hypothetical protein [Caulobacter sp. S45]
MPTPSSNMPATTPAPASWRFDSKHASLLPTVTGYIEACPDRYFVTLTTKRRLTQFEFSAAIGRMLHRVNRELFGTGYTRHKALFLATFIVFEETFAEQLHAHCLVGVPDGSLAYKAHTKWTSVEALIKTTWCSMDHGGQMDGQDTQRIEGFEGVQSYVQKRLWNLASIDSVDLANTNIPTVPARAF